MKRTRRQAEGNITDGTMSETSDEEVDGIEQVEQHCTRPDLRSDRPIESPNTGGDDSDANRHKRTSNAKRRKLDHIGVSGPAFPRSQYEGWIPTLSQSSEQKALSDLLAVSNKQSASSAERLDYVCFDLHEFSIYRPNCPRHAFELATLDRLRNRHGFTELLFDGVLSVGGEKRYVEGLRFEILSIDGYGSDDFTSLRDDIWIQTKQSQAQGVWYRLGKPTQEYTRFFKPFLWLVQFTRQFVDYLLDNDNVGLSHFRWQFHYWLNARYRHLAAFDSWIKQSGLRDFRTTVAAHIGFLWTECYSIDNQDSGLCAHPMWGEVDYERLQGIQERPNREQATIVTPFVYECFRRMYFGNHLEMRPVLDGAVYDQVASRKQALGLTPLSTSDPPVAGMLTPKSLPDAAPDCGFNVTAGDVVSVEANDDGPWKTASLTWYAYVQAVRQLSNREVMDIIWLYEPHHTTLGNAYYPFQSELFLSDNCECGKHAQNTNLVTGKIDVTLFAKDPSAVSGPFVRQKFRTMHDEDTYDFVSLQEADFHCPCMKQLSIFEECRRNYQIGDTVLVRQYNGDLDEDVLEPAQIVDFQLDSKKIELRRLRRKIRHDTNARSNELFLTRELFTMAPSNIIRKCHVRFFDPEVIEEGLPTPYDRNGAGDCFFIVDSDEKSDPILEIGEDCLSISKSQPSLPPLEPGLDLNAPTRLKKLRGMGKYRRNKPRGSETFADRL